MYFRIIVKKNDAFFFRTRRLHSNSSMLEAMAHFDDAFRFTDGFTVEVLQVTGEPSGKILNEAEIDVISLAETAQAEDASENAQPLI